MSKKKLIIYSDLFIQKSGYAKEMRDILPYLRKKYEVAYVALWYNGYPLFQDMKVYSTQNKDMTSVWGVEALQYAIEDFKPDIVLTNQDYFPLKSIAFVMAHPNKLKWVHWGLAEGNNLDFDAIEPCKWVHQHVFKTEFARAEVRKTIPEIDGPVLYPSNDSKVFYEMDKAKLRKEYNLDKNKVVMCMARPQLRKNLPVLLEAMKIVIKKIPEAALILASTHMTKTPEGAIDGHNIEGFIHLFGLQNHVIMPQSKDKKPLSDEVLNLQYNLADVNVLSSFGEGWGMSCTESGACGVPSVGPDHAATTEVIGDRGLLVKPRAYIYSANGSRQCALHPEDLAEALIKLLSDDKLRAEMGAKAKKFALSLTPESRANKFIEIFEDVIKTDKKNLIIK